MTFRIELLLIGVYVVGAGAITAGITAAGAHAITGASVGGVVAAALARGVIVAVPAAVALCARSQPAHARFGRLLLIVSGLWFLASLSNSSSPLVYSFGRVAGWVAEFAVVWALLAFPSGWLRTGGDRALVASTAALLGVLYLPTALLVQRYPVPDPWSNCDLACPHNALTIVSREPAILTGLVVPVREVLTGLVFVMVAIRLGGRIGAAKPRVRRTLVPVLVVAIVQVATLAAALLTRRIAPRSPLTDTGTWVAAVAIPAIGLAFLFGLLRRHFFVSSAIRRVSARLREMPGPQQVQDLLANAFEDPGLQIAFWSRSRRRWIAADGEELAPPAAGSGRWLSEVRDGQQRAVAILHDAALRDDSAFVGAAAAATTIAFEIDRVASRTAAMVRELKASRARILAAGNEERRRIERDLHDGAQQRLVALRIQLELAADKAEHDDPAEAAALRELGTDAQDALDEIRSLTRGIYPTLLADRGLADAVRAAARRSPVPASVDADGLGDYPPEIATAVYFCCVEALQNVAKHAPGATGARIALRESNSVLSFSVSDDGPGLIDRKARVGSGIVNMRDRMATVGGQLTLHSRPEEGVRISGRVPLSATSRAPVARADAHSRTAPSTRRRDHTTP